MKKLKLLNSLSTGKNLYFEAVLWIVSVHVIFVLYCLYRLTDYFDWFLKNWRSVLICSRGGWKKILVGSSFQARLSQNLICPNLKTLFRDLFVPGYSFQYQNFSRCLILKNTFFFNNVLDTDLNYRKFRTMSWSPQEVQL